MNEKTGCGCRLCQIEQPVPAYHGNEANEAKQAAFLESRRLHAIAVGRPLSRQVIRGD